MNTPYGQLPKPAADKPADLQLLIDTITAGIKPQRNPDQDGAHFVVVPQGYHVEDLPLLEEPPRPTSTVKLRDASSFITYWKDHAGPASRIYATLTPAVFLAVLDDYHPTDSENSGNPPPEAQGNHRQFRAEFKVPASREWETWTAANRKHMSQLGFAEFLQDNLPDVVEPSGADLLEMSLNFEAAQSGNFVASHRLQDGSHNLQWKADNNASGSIKLPELIKLRIPVFEKTEPVDVEARLRYRIKQDALAIWYELVRPHRVLDAAFRITWERIENDCSTTILHGTPE